MPRMPAFKHVCKPCDTCGSTGVVNVGDEVKGNEDGECPACEGRSRPCHCEAAYDAEGDRRYEQWRDRLDERAERMTDDE